jgi:hypothetical protein
MALALLVGNAGEFHLPVHADGLEYLPGEGVEERGVELAVGAACNQAGILGLDLAPHRDLGNMAAKAPDQVGDASLDTSVVEFYSLDRVTLAVLPGTLHEPPVGAARNRAERLVVAFECSKNLYRCLAGEFLHDRRRTTAVHPASN